ncbi:cardiolipin synthase [Cochlodiniinecator piscidefendens]|uniref:cardiolipin synthase n=1 Tax=Cochlodiniinecator piscidefendens TaxID=2715756 RepID=UPI00140E79FF|nr:cardiolipin synthase [Cochlodiniinecator piscidefendens]
MFGAIFYWTIHTVLQILTVIRAITREGREPASRIAWVVVILVLPIVGMLLYYLFGEVNIGQKTVRRMKENIARLPSHPAVVSELSPSVIPQVLRPVFDRIAVVNEFQALAGNSAELMADSDSAIDRMVADIDAATEHVHLLFYIWLTDENGLKVLEAVKRAAARGVTCRCLIDGLGSRKMARSDHWRDLAASGAKTAITFDLTFLLWHMIFSRADVRNHRKIAVIDFETTYCGSQNCADPAFLPKAKFAPWVDVVARVQGPIAWQMQWIFASDWMTHAEEDISDLMQEMPKAKGDMIAITSGTGPTQGVQAVPDMFQMLLTSAFEELVVTTPYYVPNEALHQQLCSTARRGVAVTMIFPARNDSGIVGRASRSYYLSLLEAGVRIFEYKPGLLHAKTMVADRRSAIFGSANMDRRSFDINYENNMFVMDELFVGAMRQRQETYLQDSNEVTLHDVQGWSLGKRLSNNLVAMMGPLL